MGNLFLCKAYARWLRFWYIQSPLPYELRVLLVSLFPHPKRCWTNLIDMEIEIDPSDLLQANILLDGIWERGVSCWWAYLASGAKVIMDVGAHCGYSTLIARRFAPDSAHVYAFEPNPRMHEQLERNVALNNFSHVHAEPLAVSDGPGTLSLHIRNAIEPGNTSRHLVPYSDKTILVQAVAMDEYCDEAGIAQVDAIKIDIEGGETAALLGMRRGLRAGRYGTLIIELHPKLLQPGGLRAMLTDLKEARYTLYAIDSGDAVPLDEEALPGGHVMAVHESRLATFELVDDGQRLVLPERYGELFRASG